MYGGGEKKINCVETGPVFAASHGEDLYGIAMSPQRLASRSTTVFGKYRQDIS